MSCHYCNGDAELRPYGPGGADVCFPCATATPEREQQTGRAFGALLEGAEATSPLSGTVLGDHGPEPLMPELADVVEQAILDTNSSIENRND